MSRHKKNTDLACRFPLKFVSKFYPKMICLFVQLRVRFSPTILAVNGLPGM